MGAVQSAWAVGWGLAVIMATVALTVLPQDLAWRVLFGVGLLPALLVLYVRRSIPEPARDVQATPARRSVVA
jgi:MFS family permease